MCTSELDWYGLVQAALNRVWIGQDRQAKSAAQLARVPTLFTTLGGPFQALIPSVVAISPWFYIGTAPESAHSRSESRIKCPNLTEFQRSA